MKILLAPDSFKGSLTAKEVCTYLKAGLLRADPKIEVTELPMADGGEGTVEALIHVLGGELRTVTVHNPLMELMEASYGLISKDRLAVIEMAAASGLELIDEDQRNPAMTTTYGTGELILDALDQGCRSFIIGIGGSATNDGGAGMLEALGAVLSDASGSKNFPKGGAALTELKNLDLGGLDPRLNDSRFDIACDVTNPLLGTNGATRVYGPQKGADEEMLNVLENGLRVWGDILEKEAGKKIIEVPGSGAAGGLGAGLLVLPDSVLRSGFDIIRQFVRLEDYIKDSDLIITGEGRVDGQTEYGKVVAGVGNLSKKHDKPVICIAGTVGQGTDALLDHGITAIFSILDQPMSLSDAKKNVRHLLSTTAFQLMRLIHQLKRTQQ